MRPLRPLKHSLVQLHARIVTSGSGSSTAIANGRRFHRQQQQLLHHQRSQLLVRAFSDAVDPQKWQQQSDAGDNASTDRKDAPLNGIGRSSIANVNSSSWEIGAEDDSDMTPFLEGSELLNGEHALHDIDFTAQRIGYPIFEGSEGDDNDGEIREESRDEATAKAERILAILRHSMTELDIGKVIHRIAQYATLPRVTSLSRKQFLRSLETRFGPNHSKEYEYMLAFLHGKDDVIEKLELESRKSIESSSADVSASEPEESNELLVPEIMGLHPDLVADPKFVGIVFCYCRLACLNSLKLVQRPSPGHHRGAKSSLWQVKNDFRKVLDIEGYSHFAEMMGLEKLPPASVLYDVDAVDAEWEEFNLENDRIDFRMLVAQTEELIEFMKSELTNETISKMLIAMLASVKTSKLHRKIFQEMVCNIQTAFSEQYHEAVLSKLVPFLSGNNATYEDFESELATNALQHHRLRHEAILRALLESRMRVAHILIHDIDEVDPMHSVSTKLSPEMREKVITTAWNIVSVLDDRQYHMFFSRFLKYKLAWRPNRTTFGQTFLDDARKTLGPRCADAIMPLFEETFHHLSVETLTICRVKLRHSHKLIRERAAVEVLNDEGRERLEAAWQPSRSVFYRNLPHGVTEKHLREALEHVGEVKRFVFFSTPVNGPPEDAESGRHEGDENLDYLAELDNDFGDEGEDGGKKKSRSGGKVKELKTPRKKTHVIASDHKTPYQALVEFATDSGRERALQRALQIFGVMMGGWKEYRPVFSSMPEERTSISIQDIPFGTRVGDLMEEVNRILEKGGLSMKVSASVPSGVLITNGRMEFRFESFSEAAQAVDLLHAHVSGMKSRRPPTGDDMYLETARAKRKEKRVKAVKKATRASAKKQAELDEANAAAELDKSSHDAFVDEEIVDDEFPGDVDESEEEEDEQVSKNLLDEDEETYFSADLEEEDLLTDEALALRELPRPFDVTWNTPRKARNKHFASSPQFSSDDERTESLHSASCHTTASQRKARFFFWEEHDIAIMSDVLGENGLYGDDVKISECWEEIHKRLVASGIDASLNSIRNRVGRFVKQFKAKEAASARSFGTQCVCEQETELDTLVCEYCDREDERSQQKEANKTKRAQDDVANAAAGLAIREGAMTTHAGSGASTGRGPSAMAILREFGAKQISMKAIESEIARNALELKRELKTHRLLKQKEIKAMCELMREELEMKRSIKRQKVEAEAQEISMAADARARDCAVGHNGAKGMRSRANEFD